MCVLFKKINTYCCYQIEPSFSFLKVELCLKSSSEIEVDINILLHAITADMLSLHPFYWYFLCNNKQSDGYVILYFNCGYLNQIKLF